MLKKIAGILAVIAFAIPAVAAITPLTAESTNAVTFNGAVTIANCQSLVLANDESIGNSTDAEVDITFDDDATVLGNVDLKTSVSYTNISAGDEMTIRCRLPNDSNVVQTVATIVFDYTDETVDTEDGSILFKVQVNSTDTTILTLDSSGATLGAGSFVGNGASLTNVSAANLAAGTVASAIDGSGITNTSASALLSGTLPWARSPGVTTNITLALVGSTNVLSFTNGILGSHVLNP